MNSSACSSDTESLISFLNDFHQAEEKARLKYIDREMAEINTFFLGLKEMEGRIDYLKLSLAPQYNLFTILKIHHLEARVHSPFLCNLLHPEGTHGQSRLFFDAFIGYLVGEDHVSNIRDIEVWEEYHTPEGIFDIFIKYKTAAGAFYMVIENKIYAPDQERQLERYHNVLTKTFGAGENFLIVYLTPDGHEPTEYSITPELYTALADRQKLRLMSYRYDVYNLLESCLSSIQAPVVRETVSQYKNTLKTL